VSLKSWKKEFYPKDAYDQFKGKRPTKANIRKAAAASLKKWEGALKKNLKRHDVEYAPNLSYSPGVRSLTVFGEELAFTGESCALCQVFVDEGDYPEDDVFCRNCPLHLVGHNCNDEGSVYEKGNVRSMVAALRKAKRYADESE
jgi:hypothetical protein